jgi:hypothetical protein
MKKPFDPRPLIMFMFSVVLLLWIIFEGRS